MLTGDRHQGAYGPDGRLFISTWDDLVPARENRLVGQYRVRLADNHQGADYAYPAIEVLPNGTFVAITYGHWTPGAEPYVLGVRFALEDLDRIRAANRGR